MPSSTELSTFQLICAGAARSCGMITLYHLPGTRSMRTLWLLHELGAPFATVRMPFKLLALRSADYLAVHPLGRVPALKHGDRVLFKAGRLRNT
jgi:glutathione S-transferase